MVGRNLLTGLVSLLLFALLVAGVGIVSAAEPLPQVAVDQDAMPQPTLEQTVCRATQNWMEAHDGITPDPVLQRRLATLERICRTSLNWADYAAPAPKRAG